MMGMSIESKQLMMHEIGNELKNILTGVAADSVMQAISEVMGKYEIEHAAEDAPDAEGQELLDAYLSAKRIEGRSEKTLERYRYIITKVLKKVEVPIRKISVFHIRKYFSQEKERGISDRTLESTREVLSAYFGWLQKEGLLQGNPINNMGAIKYPKVSRLPFTQTDIEKLKEGCKTVRDKAIVSFLLSTGCRISEMCALNREDVDFQAMECIVMGKGAKERTVFIDAVTAMYLLRYFHERRDASKALFAGKRGERLTPGGVRNMLRQVSEKTGVENVHPHRSRRTLATQLIEHGMPIQEVAVLLGHDQIDTTMTYVYIDKSSVKNAYKKYA